MCMFSVNHVKQEVMKGNMKKMSKIVMKGNKLEFQRES